MQKVALKIMYRLLYLYFYIKSFDSNILSPYGTIAYFISQMRTKISAAFVSKLNLKFLK